MDPGQRGWWRVRLIFSLAQLMGEIEVVGKENNVTGRVGRLVGRCVSPSLRTRTPPASLLCVEVEDALTRIGSTAKLVRGTALVL